MLNEREIFDRVKTHLLQQNEKSYDEFNGCLYRGKNGLKCAVGCLIEDDEYDDAMEQNTVDELFRYRTSFKNFDVNNERHIDILSTLQDIHDSCDVDCWPDELYKAEVNFFHN